MIEIYILGFVTGFIGVWLWLRESSFVKGILVGFVIMFISFVFWDVVLPNAPVWDCNAEDEIVVISNECIHIDELRFLR